MKDPRDLAKAIANAVGYSAKINANQIGFHQFALHKVAVQSKLSHILA